MQTMTHEEFQKFLKERDSGLGGTDAAVIVGVNPWKSPLDIYREKLGLTGERPEPTEAMRLGVYMEPYLRDRARELIEDRTGGEQTVVDGGFHRHPEHNFLIGHLDGLIIDNKNGRQPVGVIECKTANQFQRSKWGDEWTDDVPQHYLVQVQHYLGVTGLPHAYVAVLFGNSEFVVYSVARSQNLIDEIFQLEVDFWNNYIMTQEPPPIDGSKAAQELLKRMYPSDTGEVKQATPEIEELIRAYKDDFQAAKQLDAVLIGHTNQLQKFMEDASVLEFADGKITWKKSADGQATDWKKVVGQALEELSGESRAIVEQAIADNTKFKEGSRRWNPPGEWYKVDRNEDGD